MQNLEQFVDTQLAGIAQPTTIMCADFDECASEWHVSRMTTEFFAPRFADQNKLAFGKTGDRQDQVRALVDSYAGFDFNEIEAKLKEFALGTPLRPRFLEFYGKYISSECPLVFVSSGLVYGVGAFIEKYGLQQEVVKYELEKRALI